MSTFSGKQYMGAMREHRLQKRRDAESRLMDSTPPSQRKVSHVGADLARKRIEEAKVRLALVFAIDRAPSQSRSDYSLKA